MNQYHRRKYLPRDISREIYKILVDKAGARKGEPARDAFVAYMVSEGEAKSWRFEGKLGPSGMLLWDGWNLRVGYAPEDHSEARRSLITEINSLLEPIKQRVWRLNQEM